MPGPARGGNACSIKGQTDPWRTSFPQAGLPAPFQAHEVKPQERDDRTDERSCSAETWLDRDNRCRARPPDTPVAGARRAASFPLLAQVRKTPAPQTCDGLDGRARTHGPQRTRALGNPPSEAPRGRSACTGFDSADLATKLKRRLPTQVPRDALAASNMNRRRFSASVLANVSASASELVSSLMALRAGRSVPSKIALRISTGVWPDEAENEIRYYYSPRVPIFCSENHRLSLHAIKMPTFSAFK